MNEQAAMMNQQQQQLMNMNQNMITMNQMNPRQQPQPQMAPMNQSYGLWAPPSQFHNLNPGLMRLPHSTFNKALGPRSSWKGKKVDKRRKEQQKSLKAGGIGGGINTISGGGVGSSNFNNYKPPTLNELQYQNQLKTRKFFPKKNYNKNYTTHVNVGGTNNNNSRSAPFAPRNTTSFLIRAKKSGGIASLVSPCPVTPAVLPTPTFSPSREVLVDMAKEEWGVDGYGSMKGLIRLRSPGHEIEAHEDEEEDEGCSSESDVEEHVEVERRLDHDLSRFEMIYPNSVGGMEYHNVLENRVDDQDTHIAQLEEENLILKERLFLMERELGDLRRRMRRLEWRGNRGDEINEEVVENESENENENENESQGDEAHSMEDNDEHFSEENVQGDGSFTGKGHHSGAKGFELAASTEKNAALNLEDKELHRCDNNDKLADTEGQETAKNDEFSKANKTDKTFEAAQGTEAENKDENMIVHEEVKALENVNTESSDHLAPDIRMENGAAKDNEVAPNFCMENDGAAKDSEVA